MQHIRHALKCASQMPHLFFVDEIHRFSKVQQDALLPAIEDGQLIVLGATTENPQFALTPALLSRVCVLALKPLSSDAMMAVLQRALTYVLHHGLGEHALQLSDAVLQTITATAAGDARQAIHTRIDRMSGR